MNEPGQGRSFRENHVGHTGKNDRECDEEEDDKGSSSGLGEERGQEEGEGRLDMCPEEKERDSQTWFAVPEKVVLDRKGGDHKEHRQNQLHGHELDIVGKIVCNVVKPILSTTNNV